MGIWSDKHFHSHDNSTHIRFPDTIKVEENKAPTDESIRLLNEMQQKAIDNLIAKVDVIDNIVQGTIYAINKMATAMAFNTILIICKFKINSHEFVIEKSIDESEFYKNGKELTQIQIQLGDYLKSVMLWYALKSFVSVAFEQITKQKPPEFLLK